MPFREKLKKALTLPSSNSSTSSPESSPGLTQSSTLTSTLTTTSTKSKKDKKFRRSKKEEPDYSDWPEHLYKPGEPMPRPKYRGIVDKKHTDKLEAYNFGKALAKMRRKSAQSQYSPMGSRMPSRLGSAASNGPGMGKGWANRFGSVGQVVDGDGKMSRQQTRDEPGPDEGGDNDLGARKTITQGQSRGNDLEASKTITNGHMNGLLGTGGPAVNDLGARLDDTHI